MGDEGDNNCRSVTVRRNVAGQVVAFQAVSTTDGSAVTTGTPVVYVTIDGGTQGTGAGTSTHEGNGCWSYAPAQAETNGNHVVFTFTLTGAVSQSVNLYPVAFDPTDSVRIGLTALPSAAAGAAGGLPTDSTGKTAFNDLDSAGIRTAVGLASANLDTQLGDIPTVAEFEARTLVAAAYFDPATDLVTLTTTSVDAIGDAFLSHTITKGDAGSIERAFWQVSKAAASFDGAVQTSGSNTGTSFLTNISVDDYAGQVLVFVSGNLSGQARAIASVVSGVVTVQSQFTETPASGDEFLVLPQQVYSVSQIQSGLATSAALAIVDGIVDQLKTRSGYTLSILAGAIANAQNAAEAYTITLDGTAYGVTYAGLDSSGNRTGATLTET